MAQHRRRAFKAAVAGSLAGGSPEQAGPSRERADRRRVVATKRARRRSALVCLLHETLHSGGSRRA